MRRPTLPFVFSLFALVGCGGVDDSGPIDFAPPGPVAGEAGVGSFTFGVATASMQIEEDLPNADWYFWTARPPIEGAQSHGVDFVGDAVQGYARATEDISLITAMNLDAYRFNPAWARIEPTRDAIDMAALQHYDDFIDQLVAADLKPMLTVHHFSSPIWIDDFREPGCSGTGDTDLCGWNGPRADEVIAELAEFAGLLAARYGDRVDEWVTLNEPVNYLLASHGLTDFPPGANLLIGNGPKFVDVVRNYVRAHVAIYEAIKANDTVDADGDGQAAIVGYTLNTIEFIPARDNVVSDDPEDVSAAERLTYVYNYLITDSLRNGTFDANLDGITDETHEDWRDHLDFLGVQYYSRNGVTGQFPLIPFVRATPCFDPFDLGACVQTVDETHYIPEMGYEFAELALFNILMAFGDRWPDLPLTITESGVATNVGTRRAEHIVRSIEQIERARRRGVDIRGYYHWSLMDNFEWSFGYGPRFGLYTVDLTTYARTPTEGATILGQIAGTRNLSTELRARHGGLGPMTPEAP